MLYTEEINMLNRLLAKHTAYQEPFTLGGYFIQPQVVHFSSIILKENNGWHSHNACEFSILMEGRMNYFFGSKCAELQPGDAIVISAGSVHHWEMLKPSMLLGLMFHISCNGDGARTRMSTLNQCIERKKFHIQKLRDGSEIAGKLMDELREPRAFLNERICCLTRELALALFEAILVPESSGDFLPQSPARLRGEADSELIDAINFFINDNSYRKLSVKELAASMGVSINHLNKILRQNTGLTAGDFIWKRKLWIARQLLDTTNRQIKDIASSVGIDDVSYFCRRFRRENGVSPAAFRLQKRVREKR